MPNRHSLFDPLRIQNINQILIQQTVAILSPIRRFVRSTVSKHVGDDNAVSLGLEVRRDQSPFPRRVGKAMNEENAELLFAWWGEVVMVFIPSRSYDVFVVRWIHEVYVRNCL